MENIKNACDNDSYILDTFEQEGSDLEKFKKIAETIDRNTLSVLIDSEYLTPMHYTKLEKQLYKERINMIAIEQGDWHTIDDITSGLKVRNLSLTRLNYPPELLEELRKTRLIFYYETEDLKKIYFTSRFMNKSYSGFQKEVGGEILKHNDLKKAIAFSLQMYLHPFQSQFIVRKSGQTSKIFAVHSEQYKRVPIQTLYNAISSMPLKILSSNWKIDNQSQELSIEYKRMKNYIIGLELKISDTSYCSNTIRATVRQSGAKSNFYVREVDLSLNENGEIDLSVLNDVLQYGIDFVKNAVFTRLNELNKNKITSNEERIDFIKSIDSKKKFSRSIGSKKYNSLLKEEFLGEMTQKDVYESIISASVSNNSDYRNLQVKSVFKSLFR